MNRNIRTDTPTNIDKAIGFAPGVLSISPKEPKATISNGSPMKMLTRIKSIALTIFIISILP